MIKLEDKVGLFNDPDLLETYFAMQAAVVLGHIDIAMARAAIEEAMRQVIARSPAQARINSRSRRSRP
jgi:hypothetical protein